MFRKVAPFVFGLLFVLSVGHQALAQDSSRFPGIESLMNADEFNDAGLGKLSEGEIRALNAWLVRYTAGDAEVLQQSNTEVREAQKDHEIKTRISGNFTGWSGETIFRFENGQVWRQRLDGKYRYQGPANPEVIIVKNWFGFYRMTVVETGKSIGVTPLK